MIVRYIEELDHPYWLYQLVRERNDLILVIKNNHKDKLIGEYKQLNQYFENLETSSNWSFKHQLVPEIETCMNWMSWSDTWEGFVCIKFTDAIKFQDIHQSTEIRVMNFHCKYELNMLLKENFDISTVDFFENISEDTIKNFISTCA